MRNVIIFLVFSMFAACSSQSSDQYEKTDQQWYRLTKENDKWVINHPCNGINSEITIEEGMLIWAELSSASKFLILSFRKEDDAFSHYKLQDFETGEVFDLEKQKTGKNRAIWRLKNVDKLLLKEQVFTNSPKKYSEIFEDCE